MRELNKNAELENMKKMNEDKKNSIVDKFEGFEDIEDIVTARARGSFECC